MADGAAGAGTRRRRAPRRISARSLENAALFHLERHAASTESLRSVLRRKAARSRRHHEEDGSGDEALIQAVLDKLIRLGVLDDRAFGEAQVRRLRGRGCSERAVTARLREKGLPEALCRELLEASELSELEVARTYVRRRRLGPWRPDPEQRAERRTRDLAALARAGFGYEVARRVIDEALG